MATPQPRTIDPIFDDAALLRGRAWAANHFDDHIFSGATTDLKDRTDVLKTPFKDILDLSPGHTPGMLPPGTHYGDHKHWVRNTQPDYPENSFDLVYSPLALHWLEDPRSYLLKIHSILRPGGLFLANFWGGNTLTELRHCLAEVDFDMSGRIQPRIIPMMRLEDSNTLLQSTPFELKVADQDALTFYYAGLTTLARHLRRMGEGNFLKNRARTAPPRNFWPRVEKLYRKNYGKTNGEDDTIALPATFQRITITGWKNGPDIPKALKRGSASHSLEDALKP
jgi:SAM-dependent methyltransferase